MSEKQPKYPVYFDTIHNTKKVPNIGDVLMVDLDVVYNFLS